MECLVEGGYGEVKGDVEGVRVAPKKTGTTGKPARVSWNDGRLVSRAHFRVLEEVGGVGWSWLETCRGLLVFSLDAMPLSKRRHPMHSMVCIFNVIPFAVRHYAPRFLTGCGCLFLGPNDAHPRVCKLKLIAF